MYCHAALIWVLPAPDACCPPAAGKTQCLADAVLPPARLLVRNTNLNATVPHTLALYPLRVSGCTTSSMQQQHVLELAQAADISEATGSDTASQSAYVTPETRLQWHAYIAAAAAEV